MKNKQDFLITGIPRSGTTLLLHLLDKYSCGLVITEPTWFKSLRKDSNDIPELFLHLLKSKIKEIRKKIKNNTPVEVLVDSRNNKTPQNFFIRNENANNPNIRNIKLYIERIIPQEYSKRPIYIKANTYFTALLNEIIKSDDYSISAIIRHPLAVLKSWRSLDIPVSQGKLKIAELFSNQIKKISQIDDLLVRQVKILDWFYQQYYLFEKHINIIKYEKFIQNPHANIRFFSEVPSNFSEELFSMNNSNFYDHNETEVLVNALLTHGHFYSYFYDLNNHDQVNT